MLPSMIVSHVYRPYIFVEGGQTVADPGFWIRGVKFRKFRPKPLLLSGSD